MTWQLFDADQPRYVLPDRWLRIEGQRTNAIRNPRAAGAVVGNPGTAPTNWAIGGTGGISAQIEGSGVEDNIPFVDVRFTGTVAVSGTGLIWPETTTGVAALTGQAWACTYHFRQVGSVVGNITTHRLFLEELTSAPAVVVQGFVNQALPTSAPLGTQRALHQRTLSGGATVAHLRPAIELAFGVGTHDYTLRVAVPQLEQASFESSVILPPAGTPGASTRGADLVTAPLASLGIAAGGPATVLVRARMPVAFGTSGVEHTLVQMDDGTENNRFTLLNYSGTNVGVRRVLAAAASSASLGNMTPGTAFRAGFTISGGRMAGSLDGAAVVAVTGGPTTGLTTIRIGANVTGGNALFGTMGLLRLLPTALSDGDLQAAVAAL